MACKTRQITAATRRLPLTSQAYIFSRRRQIRCRIFSTSQRRASTCPLVVVCSRNANRKQKNCCMRMMRLRVWVLCLFVYAEQTNEMKRRRKRLKQPNKQLRTKNVNCSCFFSLIDSGHIMPLLKAENCNFMAFFLFFFCIRRYRFVVSYLLSTTSFALVDRISSSFSSHRLFCFRHFDSCTRESTASTVGSSVDTATNNALNFSVFILLYLFHWSDEICRRWDARLKKVEQFTFRTRSQTEKIGMSRVNIRLCCVLGHFHFVIERQTDGGKRRSGK